ncbi:holotricin-3-like [Rhipicephalus sanguineus]|uniref:holotricin-3-like n=1 Tax=Rhipicephalus sanguineus TaxID=34632 RepID=UPI0020C2FAEE|nr:holotricin-3-like [Rhipicephalus sanguineus]
MKLLLAFLMLCLLASITVADEDEGDDGGDKEGGGGEKDGGGGEKEGGAGGNDGGGEGGSGSGKLPETEKAPSGGEDKGNEGGGGGQGEGGSESATDKTNGKDSMPKSRTKRNSQCSASPGNCSGYLKKWYFKNASGVILDVSFIVVPFGRQLGRLDN